MAVNMAANMAAASYFHHQQQQAAAKHHQHPGHPGHPAHQAHPAHHPHHPHPLAELRGGIYWPGLQGLVSNPLAWRDRLANSK